MLQSHTQGYLTEQKPMRLASQSVIRQQAKNSTPATNYESQQQQQNQKTLVFKTLPLKVKQPISSSASGKTQPKPQPTAKVPHNTNFPQQPTEVRNNLNQWVDFIN